MISDRVILETATGRHVIEVRIAVTLTEQQRGLQFLDRLPENAGMLFLYRPAREVTMWMKDTGVSLDMVFIRADGVVHRIERNTEPLSHAIIPSRGPVMAVLEIAAGASARFGLRSGDLVLHSAFGPAAAARPH